MSDHTLSTHTPKRWRGLLALLVAVAMVTAACADDGDSDASTAASDEAGAERGSQDAAEIDAGADDGGDGAGDDGAADDGGDMTEADVSGAESLGDHAEDGDDDGDQRPTVDPGDLPEFTTALFVGRDIIFTGDIVVETADVAATTHTVTRTVLANGGALWGQDSTSEPTPRTVLTIRVPPSDFASLMAALTDLDGVGVLSESITTDDVTETVVDLDARIAAARAGVERIRTRLDAATDLNTIFTLEEELATRQAALERLLGQRKTLGDQIALSTITLTILEADPDRLDPEFEVVAWLGRDADDACPGVSDLAIASDGSAVLCVSISNTGEDTLTDIDIAAPAFRLRVDDFRFESGPSARDAIAPGDELLAHVTLEADDGYIQRVDARAGIPIDVDVTATPATSPTVDIARSDTVFISADVDDPLPGFADAFGDGWGAMVLVVSVLMIVVGGLLPFLPFVLVAWWIGRKAVARNRARSGA